MPDGISPGVVISLDSKRMPSKGADSAEEEGDSELDTVESGAVDALMAGLASKDKQGIQNALRAFFEACEERKNSKKGAS